MGEKLLIFVVEDRGDYETNIEASTS